MPDIDNRDEKERQLARRLGKLGRVWSGRLLEALGDPPNFDNLTEDMWEELGEELRKALRPFMIEIYEEAAEGLLDISPGGVEWGLVNQRAADWAREHVLGLVYNLNNTSRGILRSRIADFFEEQLTLGELYESLRSVHGPTRMDMIAATEITRAAVEGEKGLADELARNGIEMAPHHHTSNDDLVCPICAPRHDVEITDGRYPPLHPRCRCWVNWRVRRD
jgi:hypothetical protein